MRFFFLRLKKFSSELIKNLRSSNKGASIVLALYFLLICTVLSSLIILAGSVSVGSLTNKIELNESSNISLSCLRKISSELTGKTFEYIPSEGTSYFEQNIRSDGIVLLSSYMSDAFEKISDIEIYEKNFEIKLENMATKVSGTFSMNKNYEIEISIDDVVVNNDTELSTMKQSIKFYPLSVKDENNAIIVKLGEAEFV